MLLLLSFATEAEREKFEFLYDKYRRLLFSKAYEVLKDYARAEDAVSEAYIRIYNNLHKIDENDAARTVAFMVTITRNAALTMLAKNRRETPVIYEAEKSDGFDLEDYVVGNIQSDQIVAIIGEMDEELRNLFLLRYAYDMSNKEIARTTGQSENSVAVKLHRAKKRLSGILIERGYALEAGRAGKTL